MKVLIIDDNQSNIDNRIELFDFPKNTQFFSALNRDEATDILKENNFDLILMDLALVKNNPDPGFNVLEAIYDKKNRFGKHGSVFVISRFADPDVLSKNNNIKSRLSKFPISGLAEPVEPISNIPYDTDKARPESYDLIQAHIDLINGTIERNCRSNHFPYVDTVKFLFICVIWYFCIKYISPFISNKYPELEPLSNIFVSSMPAILLIFIMFFSLIKSFAKAVKV